MMHLDMHQWVLMYSSADLVELDRYQADMLDMFVVLSDCYSYQVDMVCTVLHHQY
jgi:hypothetical protein